MTFLTCIRNAVDTGKLGEKKAAEAEAAYAREHLVQTQMGFTGAKADVAAAHKALEAITNLKASQRWERITEMQRAAELRTKIDATEDMPKFLLDTIDRMQLAYKRIGGQFLTGLDVFLDKYSPKYLGLKHPVEGLKDIVRAAFPGGKMEGEAGAIAQSIKDMYAFAARRINMEGGTMPVSLEHGLPQVHNKQGMRKYDKAEWVNDHLERANWEIMRWRGKPIEEGMRKQVLEDMHDSILTEGADERKTGVNKNDVLGRRFAHEKFLYYKDADSWIEMGEKYGSENMFQQVIGQLDAMANAASIMEVLGPRPEVMMAYLQRETAHRASQLDLDKPMPPTKNMRVDTLKDKFDKFRSMYEIHSRQIQTGEGNIVTIGLATARTHASTALLGGVGLTSLTDAFIGRWARGFHKVPTTGWISGYFKHAFQNKEMRSRALKAGILQHQLVSMAHGSTRWAGPLDGARWAKRMSDVLYRSVGATWITQAGRNMHADFLHGDFGEYIGKSLDDIPYAASLRERGITDEDWLRFSSMEPLDIDGTKWLAPQMFYEQAETIADRRIADKFFDFVTEFTRGAVVTPDLQAQAAMGLYTNPNSLTGQVIRTLGSLISFPITVNMYHLRKIFAQENPMDKAKSFAAFVYWTTLGGAIVLQAKGLLTQGAAYEMDPREGQGREFWGRAAMLGGFTGIYGDFLYDFIRSGKPAVDAPLFKLASATWNLGPGNAIDAVGNTFRDEPKELNLGKDVLNFVDSNIPDPWQTKLLLDRAMMDHLLQEADQAAWERKITAQQKQMDEGREYWWPMDE